MDEKLKKIIPSFFKAVRFLSFFPLGKEDEEKIEASFFLLFFPLVGVFLGLMVLLVLEIFSFLPASILSLVGVIAYLFLTRMRHIDGFANTVEGFFGGKNKERTLQIMKDPRIGAYGVVALVVLILGYWQAFTRLIVLSIVNFNALAAVVVAFCVARWFLLLLATYAKSAQPDGWGEWFVQIQSQKTLLLAGILPLVLLVGLFQWRVLIVIPVLYFLKWGITKWATRNIDGINDDVLGFGLELTQLLLLVGGSLIL